MKRKFYWWFLFAVLSSVSAGCGKSSQTSDDMGIDVPDQDVTDMTPEEDAGSDAADADATVDMDVDMDIDMEEPGPQDWPENVIRIALDANGKGQATANYANFPALESVDYMSASGVACYQNRTRDEFVSGNHLMFVIDGPVDPWSEVRIKATPSETNAEAVVYSIVQRSDRFWTPPEIEQAEYCHFPLNFGGPGQAGELAFQTFPEGARNIFIGVSNRGRFAGDTTSDVTVEVEVVSLAGEDRCYGPVESPARWPEHVRQVSLSAEGSASLTGRLESGAKTCGGVNWINNSFCAPTTRLDRFEGNHVFYALDQPIPPNSILTVTAVPDPGVDISLYGAAQGAGTGFEIPPGFPVADCEASYDSRPGASRNPGDPESIQFVALNNGYNVFVGVAGDATQGGTGGYTLSFNLITWSTNDCTDADYAAVTDLSAWPSDVTVLDGTQNHLVSATLGSGRVPCTLDWADQSDNACFPETRFSFFRGATDFYALDPPPPAGSRVRVRAIPEPGVEVSLFGFRTGPQDKILPPLVNGLVQCESSYTYGVGEVPNPGEAEFVQFVGGTNPYGYFFGVAAYNDGTGGPDIMTGDYKFEVIVDVPPPPHCPESLPGASYPTWPGFVTPVALNNDGVGTTSGNLNTGSCVNLDFAEQSSVACFPATQFERFEGNHTFFTLDRPIPPRSELLITVTPQNNADVNVYALTMADYEYLIPPNIPSANCEASYSLQGPNPGQAETIRIQNPTDNSMYNVLVGVAGDAVTGSAGAFTVEMRLTEDQIFCEGSLPGPTNLSAWPASVTPLSLNAQGLHQSTGNLNTGACTNLDFAADSSVACFPATRFDRFDGNHNFYALSHPLPPNSTVTISVTPSAGTDVSLYGFQLGANEYVIPPNVPSAICRASYAIGAPNPGGGESITFVNPSATASYNIFFGVAGANGATDGAYQIQIAGQTGQIHCEESLPGSFYQTYPGQVNLLSLNAQGVASASGNLNTGACTNLAFAASSAVACFPATEFSNFRGNHVYYALRDPLPPGKRVRVTASPGGANSISLYGYTMGGTEFFVPPAVPSAVCERDFGGLNPGLSTREIDFSTGFGSPYNLLFAVAGADGVEAGAYTVEVEVYDP